MNNAVFEQAQQAYESKDFASALDYYNNVVADQSYPLQAGELGLVYHQMGNCYVKLQNYSDAINAYVNATSDTAYVSLGTVYYNLGMAYAYMNDFGNAINNFKTAINTENYRSKFKAYTAMGNALMKSGKSADAAAAFRSAAMDNHNPDPTRALLNLGVCFMALGRPIDAVTVYESTFQYNMKPEFKNRLNANLGQAYVACGQMDNAVKAFEEALRDKTYKLSDSASVDYQRAIAAVSKGEDKTAGTIAPAAAAGAVAGAAAGAAMTPEQASADTAPVGDTSSDTFANDSTMPSASEQDAQFAKWSDSAKEAAYNTKKKKSPGKIVLIVLFFFVAACIVAGSVLFCFGFGIPSQEMVSKALLSNPIDAKNWVFDDQMSDNDKAFYAGGVIQDANAHVDGVVRNVNNSTVYITGKTDEGADVTYKIKMIRSWLGWKITSVELSFASNF